MNDSENICLSCGFCCDGTVIGFVQLERKEVPVVKKIMDIEVLGENGFFLQPCSRYCDGCTIYSQRPKQCASFKCKLLKSVEQKELDFDSAIEIIQVAKQKKRSLEKKIDLLQIELKSDSFHFKMIELKRRLDQNRSESSGLNKQLELLSELKQLDTLFLKQMGVSFFS
ncbi:MAG: Fe-S-cluster containining protein [Salibacteraceae bacterium]|jgi:Fe-S-cluster containining protein